MLRRKITSTLVNWKENSSKALLITGARQIGKSYAIREFGKANYSSYFEVNLVLDKEAAHILTSAQNANDFINRVALLSKNPLVENDTLIFIDEIQEYPDIVTLIKALVEDGRYSYALSGSMLGTEFKGIQSFPVGSIEQHIMRPMDFEEFCWAIGVGQDYLDTVGGCVSAQSEVPTFLHEALLKDFRSYVVCGGMPEVVQNYIDSGFSLTKTRELQAELVQQYKYDIAKYAGSRAPQVGEVFDQIPVQLDEGTHRFKLTSLKDKARFKEFDKDFLWLVHAGVGLRVLQVSEAKLPLKRTEQSSMFRLYQSDTGMLVSRYPLSTARDIYLGRQSQNLGGIYENVVAQELASSNTKLWYYQTEDIGEVDFVMEGADGKALPIEVKSGKKVHSHAALDNLLGVNEYKIKKAIVLSANNISREDKVIYLPFYAIPWLRKFGEESGTEFKFAPAAL